MKSLLVARATVGIIIAGALSASALAQPAWAPASEIVGQPVQVTTNGVTNTVTLISGGQATISSPGGTVVNGNWAAQNGQLCLMNGAARECVPYSGPFQAGQPMTLTSSCGASETWLAASTNAPPAPPPPSPKGERGR